MTLVLPPRSQQLKLELTYDDWNEIYLALCERANGFEPHDKYVLEIAMKAKHILAALLKEGHV